LCKLLSFIDYNEDERLGAYMKKPRLLQREQLRQFIKENEITSVEDIQRTLKELFADTLQEMLEAEMDDQLGYAKHDVKNKETKNSRNGYSKKTVTSEFGDVEIEIPRDRQGEFEPLIVKKHHGPLSR
jgi:putative transposase